MLRLDAKKTVREHISKGSAQPGGDISLSKAALEIINRPVEKTLSSAVIAGIAQLVEALLLAGLGFAIYWSYVMKDNLSFYVATIFGATLLANIFFNMAHTHSVHIYRTGLRQIGRLLAAWSLVFVTITLLAFMFKISDQVSRVWLVSWYIAGAVMLVIYRMFLRFLVQRWTRDGRLKRRTVIVGGGKDAEKLILSIHESADNDIDLVGLFDDRVDERSPDIVANCPKLGNVRQLIEFARRTRLDLVIVSMPLSAEKRVLQMFKRLWVLPVDIRLSAHMSQLRFSRSAYSYIGKVAMFDMADRPISDWNLVYKWVFDRIVGLSALILLSPIMIIAAIAIKLESRGPVLFRQKRHGFNNELINIYKFRSMYADQSDQAASKLVTKNDSRVTKVGRFIRKTSIDELPQLFNVLKGELSIVGPRPHALEAKAANTLYYEAVEGYFARHRVKPGMTGWAQINGWRGETDTLDKIMQRVDHDLYYIENWSPMFDIYIVFMTPFSLFSRNENAF
ncbi:Undecaprenyl-phosphate galactosephosphotransferase [hydrothermal vent metagenome]|uniref:Undecaprenyl-phosphate galactosephosphotransferase n=1 Tax=hydrothermal vent metagenome TaxID=652676 RepID=A0A3B0TP07_9ZZZZ